MWEAPSRINQPRSDESNNKRHSTRNVSDDKLFWCSHSVDIFKYILKPPQIASLLEGFIATFVLLLIVVLLFLQAETTLQRLVLFPSRETVCGCVSSRQNAVQVTTTVAETIPEAVLSTNIIICTRWDNVEAGLTHHLVNVRIESDWTF